MEEDDILYQSIIADPEQVSSDVDVSGLRTETDTNPELLAAVSEFPGLQYDPTQYSSYADLYDLYSKGLPMAETGTTATIPTQDFTGGQIIDTSGQDQVTGGLTTAPINTDPINTGAQQNLIDQGIGVQLGQGQPISSPAEGLPQTQEQLDEFNFPALTQDSTAEEISQELANQQARLDPIGGNIMDEVALTGGNTGILDTAVSSVSTAARNAFETVKSGASTAVDFISSYGYPAYQALQGNLVAAGTALASPLTLGLGFAGKVFESLGDTKSQEEYNLYSDEQKASIDAAYGPGGVMDGYNAVSGFGEGVQATVQSRLDERRSNGIPDTSAASQELIGLQNNLGITDFTQLTQEQVSEMDDKEDDVGREINFETGEITGSPTSDVNIYDEFVTQVSGPDKTAADYIDLEKSIASEDTRNIQERIADASGFNVEDIDLAGFDLTEGVTVENVAAVVDVLTKVGAVVSLGSTEAVKKAAEEIIKREVARAATKAVIGTATSFTQDDSSEPTLSEADKEFAETGDYDVYSGTSSPQGPDYSGGVTTGTTFDAEDDGGSDDTSSSSSQDQGETSSDAGFSDPVDDPTDRGGGGGGGGSSGGGKIVCTMMNETYGFGSFRNKIWQKYAKDNLTREHEKGYHKIFLPLVRLSKTNIIVRKILEHIAVHRTIDIRQEARGKTHILGRVYRKVLEPICYLVGKYGKR